MESLSISLCGFLSLLIILFNFQYIGSSHPLLCLFQVILFVASTKGIVGGGIFLWFFFFFEVPFLV